jgi:lipopolysaccharide export system protein LptA
VITRHDMNRLTPIAACLSLWLLMLPDTYAVKKNEDEPIQINARSVEVNEKTGLSVYSGNVLVEQGLLSIKADRIEIRMRDNKPQTIRATGKPVKLRRQPDDESEEIQAEARRIDYYIPGKKLEMTGDVTVRRGGDLFTGSVLHYDINEKNLTAQGDANSGGRVHAVIQPRKRGEAPNSGTDAAPRSREVTQ